MPAVSLVAVILAVGLWEASPTELPRLPLDQYPPELRGRVAEALSRAEQEPRSASAAGALGMLLHAYDQLEPAEACYRQARRLEPRAFEWAYLEGTVEGRLGRHEAAVAALRDALRAQPAYLPARLKLAEALLATGDAAGGAALYLAILEDEPRSPQAHYGLGRVEAARRRLALYQKYLLGDPPLEDPVLDGVRRLKEGAREHLAEGVRLGKAGDAAGAIREHERALTEDPKLVQAHANLISLYGRWERWDQVEQHYRAAVALAPGLADVHYDYGVALSQQGRPREAAEAFKKALEINPYHARAHNNLGTLLLGESRFEEAAGQFRAALENEPGFRLARFNFGRVLVAQGRLREAIEELQKIVTPEDEETPRYLYALAAAYVRAGDREKGVSYAQEARRKAEALGQAELVASIDKDLRRLAPGPTP